MKTQLKSNTYVDSLVRKIRRGRFLGKKRKMEIQKAYQDTRTFYMSKKEKQEVLEYYCSLK